MATMLVNGIEVTLSPKELRELLGDKAIKAAAPKGKAPAKAKRPTTRKRTIAKPKAAPQPKANAPKYKGMFRCTEPTAPCRKATFGDVEQGMVVRRDPKGADYPVAIMVPNGDRVWVATDHPKGVAFDKPLNAPIYIVG